MLKNWKGILTVALIFLVGVTMVGCSKSSVEKPPVVQEKPYATQAELDYLNNVAILLNELAPTCYDLGVVLGGSLTGDAFVIAVAADLVSIQNIYKRAQSLNPPTSLIQFHAKFMDALAHYNNFTDQFAKGYDNLDATLINQALLSIEAGNEKLNEAQMELEIWKASRKW